MHADGDQSENGVGTSQQMLSNDQGRALVEREGNGRSDLPSIAFAFRFGNAEGFVQRFFAHHRDLVARELVNTGRCYLAFKSLEQKPSLLPQWSEEICLDFFDLSPENRIKIQQFIRANSTKIIVFQGANLGEIDIKFFHGLGVTTINTEDGSYDHASTQPFWTAAGKYVVRRVLKHNVHDLYVANTYGQRDFLSRFPKLPSERLRLVRCGIDSEFFSPGDRKSACEELGLDPHVTWIMAAAQARPEKRVDLVMRAVAKAISACPNARAGFFFVGDGVMLEEWKKEAQTLPSRADFRFFGRQSDMRRFYHAASFFVHGSSIESFGLVLAEAMASGLPVIATRAHGPAELIDHGNTGYLIERDNWDGFADAVISYINRLESARMHGEQARQRCLEYFTSDRCALDMANILRPLLAPS